MGSITSKNNVILQPIA